MGSIFSFIYLSIFLCLCDEEQNREKRKDEELDHIIPALFFIFLCLCIEEQNEGKRKDEEHINDIFSFLYLSIFLCLGNEEQNREKRKDEDLDHKIPFLFFIFKSFSACAMSRRMGRRGKMGSMII
jgi:hypothetical protein